MGGGGVGEEVGRARALGLLGFLPDSRPCASQVKAAYKRKVWETHPDRFPPHQKPLAESNFKLISEAYTRLLSATATAARHEASAGGTYSRVRVVRPGVPTSYGGRQNRALVGAQFLCLVLGTVALGGSIAARAYKRQKDMNPSHNPFLP